MIAHPCHILCFSSSASGVSKLEKAYPEIATSGLVRGPMKHSDLLEATHIEKTSTTIVSSKVEPSRPLVPPSAIATRKAMMRQPGSNRQTDMRLVVDNQDTAHNGLLAARVPRAWPRINARLISAAKTRRRLPCTVYWNRCEVQICKIAT